ncbi:MAG TPA: efflux RND transporter periplasmic adaptor subunit, partial [Negativicutes bacterium]
YGLRPFTRWAEHIIPGNPISVTAEPISTINKPVPIVRTGSIENSSVLPVTTDFPGRISEVYVKEGQEVKAGQPLLKLLGASGPSTNSKAAVNQNGAADPQAQESYDNALKEYNRLQKLYDQGAIPRRQVEEASARLQVAQEGLASSQGTAQPTRNITTVTSSDGFTTISAPVSGTVTKLSTGIDQTVQAGQQLMVLGSGEVQVVVPIEQNDLYLVYSGIPATIEVSGKTITGKVASIYPEIGPDNLPTFRTHIKVTNNADDLLKIGMAVTVRINTGKSAVVFVIPKVAVVQEGQDIQYIYLVENGKAVRQQVSIGETIGDFQEITSELPEQAIVVTSNAENIRNGDALTVLP